MPASRAGTPPASAPASLAAGLGRAFAGALIFGLPMLMTMELWEFGARMDRLRLVLLILLGLPLLVGIAHRIGFEPTFGWREDLRDALLALGVAILTSAGLLSLLAVSREGDSPDALLGRVALQSVPAAMGALLARSQLGETSGDGDGPDPADRRALGGWAGAMFLMLVGALFLSLNVAPTEEMILISYMMHPGHALALIALSLAIMHGFVYAVGFPGVDRPVQASGWSRFLRVTLPGFGLCLAISVYALWTFGRLDGMAPGPAMMATIVLAFPAAVGAAAARLIL